jgi:hypothetical protein
MSMMLGTWFLGRPLPSLSSMTNAGLDPFDRVQLSYVVGVCLQSETLSDAGREIFAVSRSKKPATYFRLPPVSQKIRQIRSIRGFFNLLLMGNRF